MVKFPEAIAQPEVRVIDSIDVHDPSIDKARAGGVTTVKLMSGSGHLLSSQTIYLKLRKGNNVEDLAIELPDGSLAGGVKVANGTNSIRESGPFPGTRGKSAALVRQKFLDAQAYLMKRTEADPKKDAPPRNIKLQTLVEVLNKKTPLFINAHLHQDIAAAQLHKKGIPFAVQSGYEKYVPKTRVVHFEAALAAAYGLPQEIALALFNGDPLETATHTTHVIIDGKVVSSSSK